jgi:tetratricopeptide (TPR) repeat protein
LKRAINLNPNFGEGYSYLAMTMHFIAQFEESTTLLEKAFRLNPKAIPRYIFFLANNYIMLEKYEKALEICSRIDELEREGKIGKIFAPVLYANIYQELGRDEDARSAMREALRIVPHLSTVFFRGIWPYKNPAHLQRRLDALLKAGLPDKPPGAIP